MASLSGLPKWASQIPAKVKGYSGNLWNMDWTGFGAVMSPTGEMLKSGLQGLMRGNQIKSIGGLAGAGYGIYKSRREGADVKGYAWNMAKYSSIGAMGHHLMKNRAQFGNIGKLAKGLHHYGKFGSMPGG